MASVTEPGDIRIVVDRQGHQKVLWAGRSDGPVNAGGAPDGVLANKTVDKMLKIPVHPQRLKGGDVIRILFKSDAADGLDASDCVFIVPIIEDGVAKQLNTSDFGFTNDIATLPASSWVELGSGYTIPSNVSIAQFGGGPLVIAIEDDTA